MEVSDILYTLLKIRPYMILSEKHAERSLSVSPEANHKDLNMIWYGTKREEKTPDGKSMIVGEYAPAAPDAGGYVLQKSDWYGLTDKLRTGHPCFSECNTILIDDLPANTVNTANRYNSITVESFQLFAEPHATRRSVGMYRDVSSNAAFRDVIEILKLVQPYANGCYEDSLRKHIPIFAPENIRKYHLEKYMKRIRLILYRRTPEGRKIPHTEEVISAIGVGRHSHFLPAKSRTRRSKRS